MAMRSSTIVIIHVFLFYFLELLSATVVRLKVKKKRLLKPKKIYKKIQNKKKLIKRSKTTTKKPIDH